MERKIIDILQCPKCCGNFELKDLVEHKGYIVKGNLICKNCNKEYKIKGNFIDFLPDIQ